MSNFVKAVLAVLGLVFVILVPPIVTWIALLLAVVFTLVTSFFTVGKRETGVIQRSFPFFFKPLPSDQVIARDATFQGFEARHFGPGTHFMLWVKVWTTIHRYPFFEIHEDHFGTVEALDGEPLPANVVFGRAVDQRLLADGAGFLAAGAGRKGPQIWILQPGLYPYNGALFRITEHDRFSPTRMTVAALGSERVVEVSSFGIVEALIGAELSEDNRELIFGQNVETQSDRYQNIDGFLVAGGNAGPQPSIITSSIAPHPLAFKVTAVAKTTVAPGFAAVRISSVGRVPNEITDLLPSTDPFFTGRKVVPILPTGTGGGIAAQLRGIRQRPYSPGNYFVHPVAEKLETVPTSPEKLCFDDHAGAVAPKIDEVELCGGYRTEVTVEVIYQVSDGHACAVVADFGSIGKARTDFLAPTSEDCIRAVFSSFGPETFVTGERGRVRDEIRRQLHDLMFFRHFDCVRVTITNVDLTTDPNLRAYVEAKTKEVTAPLLEAAEKARLKVEKARTAAERQAAVADMQPFVKRLAVLQQNLGDDPTFGKSINAIVAMLVERFPELAQVLSALWSSSRT